jgi:hypothetical protein
MTWQPELMFAEPETNRRPTQAGRILAHLQEGNRITALEALEKFQMLPVWPRAFTNCGRLGRSKSGRSRRRAASALRSIGYDLP